MNKNYVMCMALMALPLLAGIYCKSDGRTSPEEFATCVLPLFAIWAFFFINFGPPPYDS